MSNPHKDIEKYVHRELRIELEDEIDLYENAPCGYLSTLPDGTIVKVNRTLLQWLRLEKEEVLYVKKFTDLISVPGRIYYETHHALLMKMTGSVRELNYELVTANDARIAVLVNANEVRDGKGDIRVIRMMVMDITDRKRYEQELLRARRREEDERKRFSFMAEMSPSITWTATSTGIIDYINSRFYKLTGMQFSRHALDAVTVHNELKVLKEKWKRCVREGMDLEMELQVLTEAGDYQWQLLRATPYKGTDGKVIKWFGTCTNIHQQRMMQERMDEFISIASHELKTPITSVKANLQLLLSLEEGGQKKKLIAKAYSGSNKITDLVNSLLDVSKIQAGHIQFRKDRVRLSTVIENAVDAIRTVFPNGKINVFNKADDACIFADVVRIEQVVSNLLSNAIKYSPDTNAADVTVTKKGREVIIAIKDYGIGIEKEKLDKVFNRFYRVSDSKLGNRFSGLGIGLYISKQIVLHHEGRIWAESELGKGSVFYISFPLL